nr:uncharacterized protein LOC125424177 [Ziziphus jujuba var. spinosa]
MERIISPNQGAFIRGRWIVENTVIAHEVMHKIKSHKGKNSLMMIKVDLKKAYDIVEWQFLDRALVTWGFSKGFEARSPLSPLLFILCSEFLTRTLTREEGKGTIHGTKISKNAPTVSHLMYVDDLLVMCRAKPIEAKMVNDCFKKYCEWSSQQANVDKNKSKDFFKLKERVRGRLEGWNKQL